MNGRSLGVIFLCIFLILWGVLAVSSITFVFSNAIMGICAILAGIFLLLGK